MKEIRSRKRRMRRGEREKREGKREMRERRGNKYFPTLSFNDFEEGHFWCYVCLGQRVDRLGVREWHHL